MARMVVTHTVKDVDQWLACRCQDRETFLTPRTSSFHDSEGGNNVAMRSMCMTWRDDGGNQTPEHQAMVERKRASFTRRTPYILRQPADLRRPIPPGAR